MRRACSSTATSNNVLRLAGASSLMTSVPSVPHSSHLSHSSSSSNTTTPLIISRRFKSLYETVVRNSPTIPDYQREKAFDDPFMIMLFEGLDVDFKGTVREALLSIAPKRESNFTSRAAKTLSAAERHKVVVQLLQAIGAKNLISFAQIRSTPRNLLNFYEVLATCDLALATCAAEHFTFATMVATHAHESIQRQILDHVDHCKLIGTIATNEAIAQEPPYNTESRWDMTDQCFYLHGAAKMPVVNAISAEWALVAATLTVGKETNHGPHLFFVRLRNAGALLPGITVKGIEGHGDEMLEACGAGVIHFHHVRVPRESLLINFEMTNAGQVVTKSGYDDVLPMQVLKVRQRLATGALYVGASKALSTSMLQYSTNRYTVGHDGRRRHPLLAIQHIQSPVICQFVNSMMYFIGWLSVVNKVTDLQAPPTAMDETMLTGTVHFLQENLLAMNQTAAEVFGIHATTQSSLHPAVATLISLRREGIDTTSLIREVAYRSVTLNLGTTHWGWSATNLLQGWGFMDRFVKNPMYTPRTADLNRHTIFFSHKHFSVKRRLARAREIQRRKGGSEHMWYDWNTFRHEQVRHCGEALMEQFFINNVAIILQKTYDPSGAKLIRDVAWTYATSRLKENLDYHLSQRLLSLRSAEGVHSHLDNMSTVISAQAMNLANALSVPLEWRAPSGYEPYWTIPGTTMGVERRETVAKYKAPSKQDSHRKEDQESLVEEDKEHDLLHGLDKKKGDEDTKQR